MYALPPGYFQQCFARYERLRLSAYAALRAQLQSQPADPATTRLEALLEPLAGVSARAFLDHATPFFWWNVIRCVSGTGDLAQGSDYLGRSAFDAFFDLLPDGAALALPADGGDILLPRLGLRVPAALGATELRRVDGGLQIRCGDGAELAVRPGQPAVPVMALTQPIAGRPDLQILAAPDLSLVDSSGAAQARLQPAVIASVADKVAAALDLVRRANPELAGTIDRLSRWYVPVHTDNLREHRSFTAELLPGVVFLSDGLYRLPVAEAIVHEYHHAVLNVVDQVEPVMKDGGERLFYSPWRGDPRPVHGLFHAIYVFWAVGRFCADAEAVAEAGEQGAIRYRRRLVHRQLVAGLAQLPPDLLTATGQAIMARIQAGVHAEAEALTDPDPAVQHRMTHHLERWRADNPGLASQVVPW